MMDSNNTVFLSVLRIRNVYPGSEYFPSRIRSKEFKYFNPSKLFLSSGGLFIPDPDLDFLPIPDPGVKKAPDPESGSATLLFSLQIGLPPVTTAKNLFFFTCSCSMMDSKKPIFLSVLRIRDAYPGSRIRIFSIPDPHQRS
jgi:hypothetical protein